MRERHKANGQVDQLPRVSQELTLICQQCGGRAAYDVGSIFYDVEGEGEETKDHWAFTNYFRCVKCGSGGPWELASKFALLARMAQVALGVKKEGFYFGALVLFDGTSYQTPAMAEEYLLELLRKEPSNAFLYTRLGNLFRGAGQREKCVESYRKAVALDPGDIEARYHLFNFAAEAQDVWELLIHGPKLVGHMLKGRVSNKEELTEGMAYSVVDLLMGAPAPFKEHFLGSMPGGLVRAEEIFIRTLLAQTGDEEEIRCDAAERLLDGEPAPLPPEEDGTFEETMKSEIVLIDSLAGLVEREGLDRTLLVVPLKVEAPGKDRHAVPLSDGKKMVHWPVASLRELFRGNRMPPADIEHYPAQYTPYFFFIESHVLTFCRRNGARTDQEMEEVYTMLRKRPDGKSLGASHDFVWQVTALMLGIYVLSGAEFEAIFATLTRSTRRWGLKPISRNYAGYLETNFPDVMSSPGLRAE